HSVTQSSFDNPCFPLQGGFDSGVTGNPAGMLTLPEWNITITDTEPIYYFCKVTTPLSHCTAGMVGTINVPVTGSNTSYQNFSLKAKAIIPSGAPVLSGFGATATSTPIPTMNQTNVTTTALSSTSTSSSTSSTSSQTSPPTAAAATSGLSGGAIGGI
ncbi:hypothetical protein BU17DRAFT_20657, partial [Hysterangium stoloniferum]